MKITDILSNVVGPGGLASSNRYHVSFEFKPSTDSDTASSGLASRLGIAPIQNTQSFETGFPADTAAKNTVILSYLCDELNLPGYSVSTGDLKGYVPGINARYAHTKTFRELSMTFLVDRNHLPLKFLHSWVEYIFPNQEIGATSDFYYLTEYYNNYTCDILIEKLEAFNTPLTRKTAAATTAGVSKFRIYNAFPYIVNDIGLSNGPNQPLKIQASFYFEHMRRIMPSETGAVFR